MSTDLSRAQSTDLSRALSRQTGAYRPATVTLAQAGTPSRVRMLRSMRKPEDSDSLPWTAVLLFAVIVLLALVAAQIVRKLRALLREPAPKLELFNELVEAHELTRAEQKALRRLARREKLSVPARVFVQPAYLKAWAPSDPVYRELFEKLFGG